MTKPEKLTIRPQGPRIVAYGVIALTAFTLVMFWRAMPDYFAFSPAEQFTLTLLLIAVLAMLHGVGRSYVRADADSIEVLNGYKRRRYTWDQVEGISMREGAPWPTLVTTEDERINLFAIQRTDGAGRQTIAQLRAWADQA